MKKTITAFFAFLITLLMAGCGSFPEMSQEQETQIVNYAAAVALKYDGNYENRLVDLALYPEEEHQTESKIEEEKETGMDPVADTETIDISEDKGYHSSMEEFFGVSGISIRYIDCFFADSYPEDNTSNYFTLDAANGKKLLVMNFTVSNLTQEDVFVDFFSVASTIKVSVNGEKGVETLSTILLDDLSNYKEILKKGESVELVLLAEINADDISEVENMDLTMKSDTETAKISLK